MPSLRNIFDRLTRRSRGHANDVAASDEPVLHSEVVGVDGPTAHTPPFGPSDRDYRGDTEWTHEDTPRNPTPSASTRLEPEAVFATVGGPDTERVPGGEGVGHQSFYEPTSSASMVLDDDVLYHDHLLLECPYCGVPDQRVGSRCDRCGQVIVRLPVWAQRRRQNWITRRLSLRRVFVACVIALFIVFVIWVNYPFAPDPVILFKNTQSKMTIDSGTGSWSVLGHDLRHSRYVGLGPPPPPGDIVWTSFVGEPLNGEPVAQRANIYLSSANGIYPLAEHDGRLREGWDGETPGRITGAPAIIESYLFFGSTDHTVNAWNAFTGDPLWSFVAEDTVEVSPVVNNGLVHISSGEGWVYALDAANGSLIWKKQLDSNASAAGAVHEGRLILGDDKGILYILSARTGQEWFRYRTPRAVTGTPVVSEDGNRVYFAAGGELYAVNGRNREIPGLYQFKQVWAQLWLWQVPGVPRPRGQQGGLWRFTPENPLLGVKSSPAIAGDSLYVGGHDHNMYAINAIDGNLRWSFQAGEAIWAPPLVVKDRLIFGDGDGSLYSLVRETGEPEWHLSLGSPIKVAPTLVNDLLIVRTVDGSVYAIGDCSTPQRGNAPGCLSGQ